MTAKIIGLPNVRQYAQNRERLMDKIWDIAIKQDKPPAWWHAWFKKPMVDLIMNR